MREWLGVSAAQSWQGLGKDVAVITECRFSGATHGCMVGHISPEAAHGGRIARLRNGDTVRIDVARRRIDVAADLGKREPRRIAPRVTPGPLAKYARHVGSASRGAVTAPCPPAARPIPAPPIDRQRVVNRTSVSVRVELSGRLHS